MKKIEFANIASMLFAFVLCAVVAVSIFAYKRNELITGAHMTRVVTFQGRKYSVPEQFKFIARDSNGEVYAYIEKPKRFYGSSSVGGYTYSRSETDFGERKYLGNTEMMEIKD